MNSEKIERLKSYIKDFYKCEVCFIEGEPEGLLIHVTIANVQYRKAFKLTCMETVESYEVVGSEDIDYSSTLFI